MAEDQDSTTLAPDASGPAPQPPPAPSPPAPPTVQIDGRTYPVGRLTYADVCQFCVWARKQRPDPLGMVIPRLDKMPVEAQKAAVETAIAYMNNPVVPGTPEFFGAVYSEGGLAEILALAVGRKAGLDREATDAAAAGLPFGDGQRVVNHALGLIR